MEQFCKLGGVQVLKFPSTSSALSPGCDPPKNHKNESPLQLCGPAGELILLRLVGAGFFQITVKEKKRGGAGRKAFNPMIYIHLINEGQQYSGVSKWLGSLYTFLIFWASVKFRPVTRMFLTMPS